MKYFLILTFIMTFYSCNSAMNKDKLKFTAALPNNYNASIRWKRFDNLKAFIDADDYKKINKIKKKYKDSTINSYKILLMKSINDKKHKVVIEREEVLSPSNTLKTNIYIQYWNYDEKVEAWKIDSEIKDEEE